MTAMKHVVIGTAGHIDHGKSALVHALTGTDPDRLKEEKERGITIDLGFAFLEDDESLSLAFVDVPGHERFVKNMLAGVGGIDLVVLVVAADESVMPQTREHFDICRLLSIDRGVIALTKSDLVDEELMELAALETKELVAGSFLENAPVVHLSAKTGDGVEELKRTLVEEAQKVPDRKTSGIFRLPADRVFSMKGFGTVVTGTIAAGAVDQDDEIEIQPTGLKARVRGLQVHGQKCDRASAGQRAAVNLHGVDVDEIGRGDTLTPSGAFLPSHMLDIELFVLEQSPVVVKDLSRVHLHIGTAQVLARVRLLGDVKKLSPGERGVAQLRLESPVVAARGDRFILRRYSPLETIAGGVVLDAYPEKHAVRSAELRAKVEALRDADLDSAATHFITEAGFAGIDERALSRRLAVDAKAFEAVTHNRVAVSDSPRIFVAPEVVDAIGTSVADAVAAYQKKNPLLEGMPKSELKEKAAGRAPVEVFELVLGRESEAGRLKVVRDLVSTADHSIQMSPEETKAREVLVSAYLEAGYRPQNLEDVARQAKSDVRLLERVRRVLLKDGTLVQIAEGMVFHHELLDTLKTTVRAEKAKSERLDVSGFKEMVGVTRKHAIPLLEWLDRERITRRAGNDRVIL